MAGKKAKFALTDFFNNLFNNFGKIVFTNLLFAVPLAVLVTAFYFLDSALKLNGYFILMLSIIPLSPFFAGVTLVTSRLARGKENVDVFKTFIEGIKNNWKRFLIHGVITYFAVIFSYFSIRLYSALISQPNADSFFLVMLYVCLIISIIIAVAFLFIFFYVPSMTVTFDLSLKNIYKNSALMSFGELKHNIIATSEDEQTPKSLVDLDDEDTPKGNIDAKDKTSKTPIAAGIGIIVVAVAALAGLIVFLKKRAK